jgi:hypothetical protein
MGRKIVDKRVLYTTTLINRKEIKMEEKTVYITFTTTLVVEEG